MQKKIHSFFNKVRFLNFKTLNLVLKYAFDKVKEMQQARKLPNPLVELYYSCRASSTNLESIRIEEVVKH